MLKTHLQILAAMRRHPALMYRLRHYFSLPARAPFHLALRARGIGQADLVLALLRINTRKSIFFAERLIGKPITRGQACLLRYRVNGRAPTVLRQPRVVWVTPINPHPRLTDSRIRFSHYQLGRTEQQLRLRGLTRRDIRTAIRNNWIQMQ